MYATLEQIKRANRAHGHHFFSPDTMRFFRSRIAPGVIGGRYFITSEQFDERSPRLYSIRVANDDGSVDRVGDFQYYPSLQAARKAARAMVNGDA